MRDWNNLHLPKVLLQPRMCKKRQAMEGSDHGSASEPHALSRTLDKACPPTPILQAPLLFPEDSSVLLTTGPLPGTRSQVTSGGLANHSSVPLFPVLSIYYQW